MSSGTRSINNNMTGEFRKPRGGSKSGFVSQQRINNGASNKMIGNPQQSQRMQGGVGGGVAMSTRSRSATTGGVAMKKSNFSTSGRSSNSNVSKLTRPMLS